MPVYSATSTQWPLLQSKTEQKFKSGLFNVSAEFIRPVGNTELPETIETSIGPVDVWPEPTVTTGTDGFERINATCYGVWDSDISSVTYGYEIGQLVATWSILDLCTYPTGCTPNNQPGGDIPCGGILAITNQTRNLDVIFETVHVSKIGDDIPAIPQRPGGDSPFLRVLSTNGTPISELNISAFDQISPSSHTGTFNKPVTIVPRLSSVKKNVYGQVNETEAVYTVQAFVSFGTFTTNTPNCS